MKSKSKKPEKIKKPKKQNRIVNAKGITDKLDKRIEDLAKYPKREDYIYLTAVPLKKIT